MMGWANPGGRTASCPPYGIGAERTDRATTGTKVRGYRISQSLRIVRGIVVRSPSVGQGVLGGFRSLAGGNINEFLEVCEAPRHKAYPQRLDPARELGSACCCRDAGGVQARGSRSAGMRDGGAFGAGGSSQGGNRGLHHCVTPFRASLK